jgi:hypothetical protein
MESKKYAKLFNEYEFISKEHLDIFLQTLDKELSIHCIISAVKSAYERGAFNMGEVELISKSIRVLSEIEDDKEEENNNAEKKG